MLTSSTCFSEENLCCCYNPTKTDSTVQGNANLIYVFLYFSYFVLSC